MAIFKKKAPAVMPSVTLAVQDEEDFPAGTPVSEDEATFESDDALPPEVQAAAEREDFDTNLEARKQALEAQVAAIEAEKQRLIKQREAKAKSVAPVSAPAPAAPASVQPVDAPGIETIVGAIRELSARLTTMEARLFRAGI